MATAADSTSASDCVQLARIVAQLLKLPNPAVENAVRLLSDGNTLPFIARYRKDQIRGLNEEDLRRIEDELKEQRDIAARKQTVLKTIAEQNALTPELKQNIEDCFDRQTLENLYLPFRPKRQTKADAARKLGLQPVADRLKALTLRPAEADAFLTRYLQPAAGLKTIDDVANAACDIITEEWSQQPRLNELVLKAAQRGRVCSAVKRGKKDDEAYSQYHDFSDSVQRIPSHRFLAMKRGEAEGVLRLSLEIDEEHVLQRMRDRLLTQPSAACFRRLQRAVTDCLRDKLLPRISTVVLKELKQKADSAAIAVFSRNIRQLLLAAPAGEHTTIGIDPGFRTGCKVAVVAGNGDFVENTTIFPTAPRNDTDGAAQTLLNLIERHQPAFIAIGNGTASRETDQFVGQLIRTHQLSVTKVVVSESGASVYSASPQAAAEYPDLDVTVRGAISIAHRLQDPLAELVKIDPRSIGVGQYQHDVDQTGLKSALDREVQSCVSSVGVDLNTASEPLLACVPGIGPALAANVVEERSRRGRFDHRQQLLKVARLGQKAFQQAAGFLRIREGSQPLDNSAVHPEQYELVNRIAQAVAVAPDQLLQNADVLKTIQPNEFASESCGPLTVADVLQELQQPGRDPRPPLKTAEFRADVNEIQDLSAGMKLEGTITNITAFGAFVDVGVHQDGLIHISKLADHYVSDPADVVSIGEVVQVQVEDVDVSRKRISLSRIL